MKPFYQQSDKVKVTRNQFPVIPHVTGLNSLGVAASESIKKKIETNADHLHAALSLAEFSDTAFKSKLTEPDMSSKSFYTQMATSSAKYYSLGESKSVEEPKKDKVLIVNEPQNLNKVSFFTPII